MARPPTRYNRAAGCLFAVRPNPHLMAGTADYILKIVAEDTEDFARIHRQYLTRLPGVAQMQSSFALRTVFKTTALPV